jgi:hypothetical protein
MTQESSQAAASEARFCQRQVKLSGFTSCQIIRESGGPDRTVPSSKLCG